MTNDVVDELTQLICQLLIGGGGGEGSSTKTRNGSIFHTC